MSLVNLPKGMLELKILLVEDMTFYHSLIPQMLANYGFMGEFITSKTLKETEKVIKDFYKSGSKIDLIITDHSLPDGTGIELIKNIRQNKVLSNIPIIMVTTEDNNQKIVDAISAGVDNYSYKPIEEKDFMEKLIFIWEKRQKTK
jgi:DNA-binding response OmpR family regulator